MKTIRKTENIDDINSNWVKVEVQSGAKDWEGNTISRFNMANKYGKNSLAKRYETIS